MFFFLYPKEVFYEILSSYFNCMVKKLNVEAILSLRVWFLLLTRPVKEISENSHHCPYAGAHNSQTSLMGGFRIKLESV